MRFVFLSFALVIAYPYIPGPDSNAFKGVSLFLGVLFSLGSSSVRSNVIACYSMTYRRAFKVGDRVRIDKTFGGVMEMSVLVTHILIPKNEWVIIPNSKILNDDAVNYSAMAQGPGLILHHRRYRLRDVMVPGRGHAADGGGAHARTAAKQLAVRAAQVTGRFCGEL